MPCNSSERNRGPTGRLFLALFLSSSFLSLLGLSALTWKGGAEVRKISREPDLYLVSKALTLKAATLGHYPARLEDVEEIKRGFFDTGEVDPLDLNYVAAGKPYDRAGNEHLFFEVKARRYGLRNGWFDFYQNEPLHFRTGEPPAAAETPVPESGGGGQLPRPGAVREP